MKKPINLRVAMDPYPHLRDDEGCVLANYYIDLEKIDFILKSVREKIEHEEQLDRVAPEGSMT